MNYRTLKVSILLSSVLFGSFLTGCQSITRTELDEVRNLAQDAQRSATAAEETANKSISIAVEARSDARDAKTAAENAQSVAGDASTCCAENTQRIERMFETLQQK